MSQQQEQPGCIARQMLSDDKLLAAIDGDADAATLEHLRHCRCCSARADLLYKLQCRLRRLARQRCPSTLTLIDYYLRLLDSEQHAEVAAHLRSCPACLGDLAHIIEIDELGAPLVKTP